MATFHFSYEHAMQSSRENSASPELFEVVQKKWMTLPTEETFCSQGSHQNGTTQGDLGP